MRVDLRGKLGKIGIKIHIIADPSPSVACVVAGRIDLG